MSKDLAPYPPIRPSRPSAPPPRWPRCSWHGALRAASPDPPAERCGAARPRTLMTVVAAGMATAVAMTGMWRFFGAVLHFSGAERAAMFASWSWPW